MKINLKLQGNKPVSYWIDKSVISIGRSAKCDVSMANETLSRVHCSIELKESEYFITDLGSANGVIIDGVRIPPHTPTLYSTFQQLELGIIEVQITEDEEAPPLKVGALNKTSLPRSESVASEPPLRKKGTKKLSVLFAISLISVVGLSIFFKNDPAIDLESTTVAPGPRIYMPNSQNDREIKEKIEKLEDTTADVFYTEKEYASFNKRSTCEGFSIICQDLRLGPYRGVVKIGAEHIFFFNTEEATKGHTTSTSLKSPLDKAKFWALHTLLTSSLYLKYLNQKVSQIHLVGLQEKLPKLVIRLHMKDRELGQDRMSLLKDLRAARDKDSFNAFLKNHQKLFKIKSF